MSTLYRHDGLLECEVIKRRNRFAVSVRDLQGGEHLAHLTNSGRLLDLIYPGNTCICVPRVSARTTLRLIAAVSERGGVVLIDPAEQSRAFEEAAARGLIPWLDGWRIRRREVTVGESRIDFEIESASGDTGFLEVKSAAMLGPGGAGSFPDCPTVRGQKHLATMRRLAAGCRSVLLFIVTHPEAESFAPSPSGDPVFARDLAPAAGDGLEVRAIKVCLERTGRVVLERPSLPCSLS